MIKYKKTENEKVSAWIDINEYAVNGSVSAHLMVCNNGYQSSGAALYSIEAARAALDALTKFVAELEAKQ